MVTALEQLESAFYELFPDARTFYLGLKGIIVNGADGVDITSVPQQEELVVPDQQEKPAYVSRTSMRSKIFTTVSDNNRVMTSGEIVEKLKEADPDINSYLSQQLTYLRKEGMLINYSPTGSKRDTYWGLRNWRDEEGNFKEDYLPELYK
ncbi:MAG: hypothetical protein H7Y13_17695 [Sphingobacteriaceae bacterium]|nr:hypothetical protein [Sphingobacteriaceae bacterium]